MKERIVNFIQLLRESNVRISIAESIEACKALKFCSITNKEEFKIALLTTLIKQSSDIPVFNKIFDLYFSEPIEDEQEEMLEEDFNSLLEQLQQEMGNEEFEQLEQDIEQNNVNNSKDPFDGSSDFQPYDKDKKNKDLFKTGSESDLKEAAKQLANSRNFEERESEDIDNTADNLMIKDNLLSCKTCAKNETPKHKQAQIEEKFELFKKFLKEEIEKAMVKQFGESIITDLVENNNILDKDLADLTTEELEKIQQMIKKMAKKLVTHISRKEKRAKKGHIDIRRTIRASIQYGNTSSELKFKKKKKTKSELVVLCDISGSVWMYVNFMLQLVVGIQNVFDRVESYIFIDHIKNVTDEILTSDNLAKTISKFLSDSSLGYGTDYGNVFEEFANEENLFNKKTILIIMGDAENTGKTLGDNHLKFVSELCKAVFWLHPKDEEHWSNRFCQIDAYGKYCKEVNVCSTLRQLEDFIKKLIKI